MPSRRRRPPASLPSAAAMPAQPATTLPEATLRQFLTAQLPSSAVRGLVVGLSGGLDSRVLLHALARLAPDLSLRALHVHHGLSPHADTWAEQVAAFCAQEGVPLTLHRVRVERCASLENAARAARHAAFAEALQEGEALLLAQHRDDQAETLLFRLLRGSGLTGLGAMRAVSAFGLAGGANVPCWRPFLGLARADLEAYARARGLSWVEDESNADTSLDRNFLRHEVLPRLTVRWPAAARTLAATALRLQEAEDLLQELAGELAADCVDAQGRLSVTALLALPSSRQRLLLRHWLRQRGFILPDAAVLEEILISVAVARPDAEPCVSWQGTELRRYRDHLYALLPQPAPPAEWEAEWTGDAPLALPDGRWLALEGEGAPSAPWRVRYRRGGERLRATAYTPSRELTTWLQEQGVPPWERARLPLLFAGDELVAVGELVLPGPLRTWRLRLQPAL